MCDLAADWGVWMATAHAMAKVAGERTALFVTNGHYRIVRVTDERWLHRKGVLTAMLAHDAAVRGYRRHIDRGIEQLAEMANLTATGWTGVRVFRVTTVQTRVEIG